MPFFQSYFTLQEGNLQKFYWILDFLCLGKTMILRGLCLSTGFVKRVPKYQPVV